MSGLSGTTKVSSATTMPAQNSQRLSALMRGKATSGRAEHQRHQVIGGEAGQAGDEEGQDHRRAVEIERGVVGRSGRQVLPEIENEIVHESGFADGGLLDADAERHDAGDGERGQRADQVEDADPLVVRREDPLADLEPGRRRGLVCDCSHRSAPEISSRRRARRRGRRACSSSSWSCWRARRRSRPSAPP